MPNYTKTIQLEKPLQTEAYDVDKRNANWDKIDAAITEDRDSADKHSKNPSAHANGIAGNAGSATKLKTARQITLSGNVSGSAYFDGSKNITINVNRVTDAEKLTNSRQITLSGDVNGSAYFDGSSNININVNSRHSAHASNADNAGYANWANGANWAKGADALAGNEALYNYLRRHNNMTIPKTNVEINKLGIFARYFAGWGQIDNQPTEWGQLINLPAEMDMEESLQFWIDQSDGRLYSRKGNKTIKINDMPFVRFLRTEDISGDVSNPNAWWVKLNGKIPLIIQGGLNVGGNEFYFPIAFPNAVLSVQGVIHDNGGKLLWLPTLEVNSVTKEKASIWSDYGGRTWLVIGY